MKFSCMIRRRDLFACATVCAVSFAWSALLCVYVVPLTRRQRADRQLVERLESSLRGLDERLASALDAMQDTASDQGTHAQQIQDASNILVEDEEPQPRLVGRGRTRGARSVWLWEDWEQPDGTTQRRFVARVPLPSPPSSEVEGAEGAPLVGAGGAKPPERETIKD